MSMNTRFLESPHSGQECTTLLSGNASEAQSLFPLCTQFRAAGQQSFSLKRILCHISCFEKEKLVAVLREDLKFIALISGISVS